MLFAMILVATATACLGAVLAASAPGAFDRLLAVGRWLRRRRAQHTALPRVSGAAGQRVTLLGTLRGDEKGEGRVLVATAAKDQPNARTVSTQARSVWLDFEDGSALIDGEADVSDGSIEIAPGQKIAAVEKALGDVPAELLSIGKRSVRCLRHGDRVLATGRLESAPELDGPAGYRSKGARYKLSPHEAGGAVVLTNVGPSAPFVRRRTRILAACVAAPLAAGLGLGVLNSLSFEPAKPVRIEGPSFELQKMLREHLYEDAAVAAAQEGEYTIAAHAYFMTGNLKEAAAYFHEARKRRPHADATFNELDAYLAALQYDRAEAVIESIRDQGEMGGKWCFQAVLHLAATGTGPVPEPMHNKLDYETALVCTLALAQVRGVTTQEPTLERAVAEMDNMYPTGDDKRGPGASEMDRRVAALLLPQKLVPRWPFKLPSAEHMLAASGPYFRMPLPGIENVEGVMDRSERSLDQVVMRAVHYSFIGDHERAALMYRQALLSVELDSLVPAASPEVGRRFGVKNLDAERFRASAEKNKNARSFATIGAALAIRAGEPAHAKEYIQLLDRENDWNDVRRYLLALDEPGSKTELAFISTEPYARRAILEAGFGDQGPELIAALGSLEDQGLWPMLAGRLTKARPHAAEWARGGDPTLCTRCGFYGALAFWSSRRLAAQALGLKAEEDRIQQRIGRLWGHVDKWNGLNVLLYVSGRLAQQ